MTDVNEQLRTLTERDWRRLGALLPVAVANDGEVDGFRNFVGAARDYAEIYVTHKDDKLNRRVGNEFGISISHQINTEMAGFIAAASILAYRRYLEEVEALDRMKQHFALELIDPEE